MREKRWFERELLKIREDDRVAVVSRALTALCRQERRGLVNGLRILSMTDGSLYVYGFRCETDEEYRRNVEQEQLQRRIDIERFEAFKARRGKKP